MNYVVKAGMLPKLCDGRWMLRCELEAILRRSLKYALAKLVDSGVLEVQNKDAGRKIGRLYRLSDYGRKIMRDSIHPLARDAGANPTLVVRHENCMHYTRCLNYAARNDWDSFGCLGCPVPGKYEGT